jgi:hypothetical protein
MNVEYINYIKFLLFFCICLELEIKEIINYYTHIRIIELKSELIIIRFYLKKE